MAKGYGETIGEAIDWIGYLVVAAVIFVVVDVILGGAIEDALLGVIRQMAPWVAYVAIAAVLAISAALGLLAFVANLAGRGTA